MCDNLLKQKLIFSRWYMIDFRCLLVLYALLMVVGVLGQIGSVFAALELRKVLAQAAATYADVNDDLNQ